MREAVIEEADTVVACGVGGAGDRDVILFVVSLIRWDVGFGRF